MDGQPIEPYARLAGVYDEIVVDPCFPLWADFLDRRWRTDAHEVRTILDVCCGTGLLAAELIDRGYRVVGVDASRAMLDRAAGLLGPTVPLLHQTLPHLHVESVFDAAVSTFDGLNYLSGPDFTASLAAIGACLRPGGWLVFDLHTDAMLAHIDANRLIVGETDGHAFEITSDVDVTARTCTSRIMVTRDGDTFVEDHTQYFHSDAAVHEALDLAGFTDVLVVDEYTEAATTKATLRATWLARRQAGAADGTS